MLWPISAVALSVSLNLLVNSDAVVSHIHDHKPLHVAVGGAAYFSCAWLAARLAGVALERTRPRRRPVPKLLLEIVTAAFFVFASLATILLAVGQNWSTAIAGSGILVAILGFALRGSLADVFSGIALGLEAPYRIGDWISINDDTRGKVTEIGWRTTRLFTRDDTYVILPNSAIARQKLTNYSAPRRKYRGHVHVKLGYDIPVAETKQILAKAAAEPATIVASPAPDVRVSSYDEGGVQYRVRFWVPSFVDDIDCRDDVYTAIDAALRRRAGKLPFVTGRAAPSAPLGVQCCGQGAINVAHDWTGQPRALAS